MRSEDAVRRAITRLVALGVTQKAIAAKLGVSDTWLSRWLKKEATAALRVPAMDRFYAYVNEIAALTQDIEQARTGSGPSPPVSERRTAKG